MNKLHPRILRATLAAALLTTPAAWAESGVQLAEVQKAYADVDYESTRRLAKAALEHGGHDRASTSELYLLWATSAAALDQTDEARTAFLYALALNPDTRLEKSLSPKIRAPYLEARGSLPATDGKPPLQVTLKRHRQELELNLRDVAHVAARIELSTRANETEQYARRQFEATPTKRVPLPSGAELQFFLHVLDRYGNVLFELGRADEPERLALVGSGPTAAKTEAPAGDVNRTPYFITAGALAALGVAAGSVSTVMYLRREDAAREWNGSSCQQPGMTRQAQCGDVDSRRRNAEYMSIGFAATGGGLLLGSLVSVLLAPSASPAPTTVAVDAAPGNLMLRLRTTL